MKASLILQELVAAHEKLVSQGWKVENTFPLPALELKINSASIYGEHKVFGLENSTTTPVAYALDCRNQNILLVPAVGKSIDTYLALEIVVSLPETIYFGNQQAHLTTLLGGNNFSLLLSGDVSKIGSNKESKTTMYYLELKNIFPFQSINTSSQKAIEFRWHLTEESPSGIIKYTKEPSELGEIFSDKYLIDPAVFGRQPVFRIQ